MSGALRDRASACSRARAVTDYRDVFLARFDGFAGRFSAARTRRDDRSGSAPIFVSASGFSRLGLSNRPPYPSARDARLTIPPPFPPFATAPRSSAPPPSPLSSRRLRRPARPPSPASPRSLSLPGYVISQRYNHSRDACNRIHARRGSSGARNTGAGTGRPRSNLRASPRARYGRRLRVASADSGPASTPGFRLFLTTRVPRLARPVAWRGNSQNQQRRRPFPNLPSSPLLFLPPSRSPPRP